MTYLSATSQNLRNTEWIKIKVEREDGSLLIDRKESEDDALQYYFIKDSVYFSSNHQYTNKLKYSIQNNVLSIGDFAKYKIDSAGESLLVLSQFNNEIPGNRLNRYYFINSDFLFDYLKKNQKLHITDSSQIDCDNHICPTFTGNFFDLFKEKFKLVNEIKFLRGYFIINSAGWISNMHVDSSKNFSHGEIESINKIISATSNSWILPPTPGPFQFKISFAMKVFPIKPLYGVFFEFFPERRNKRLSLEQMNEADQHFDKGNRFFDKKNYQKAVFEFERCIAIDSLYVDAYYNLAYTYQQLGKKEMACQTWKKLSEMGQKQGEALYDQNCK